MFSFGPGAIFHGSTGNLHLNAPIVAMAGSVARSLCGVSTTVGSSYGLICAGVGSGRTIGGVRLFREALDRSESAVPTVGDLGQRLGCFGETLFADLVADLASLTVPVDQSDALQERRGVWISLVD